MSFESCMSEAVRGGEISEADARRLKREYDRFRDHFAQGSGATADAEAKRALEAMLKAESEHERYRAKLAMRSIKRVADDIFSHGDVAEGALYHLEHFGEAKFDSVETRRKEILGVAHARMEQQLYEFRRGAVTGDPGRHRKASLPETVKALFGEKTGDVSAQQLAKVWTETAEWLRQRFNAAGGAIAKLENWGLPQHHDARAVRKRGQKQWKADIRPMLDITRMKNPMSGLPMTESELSAALDQVYRSIATEGWADREPVRQRFGSALASRHAEHRFLVFKDAASWLQYQRDYGGGGDPFAAMMGHVNSMARDISAMEVLGPNPAGTIEWLVQAVEKEAQLAAAGEKARWKGKGDPLDRAARYEKRIRDVWGSIRGDLETPVNSKVAAVTRTARLLITASVLGQAVLTSVTDIGTSAISRAFAGVGASGTIPDMIRAMTPQGRRDAVAAGLILDNAQHVFHAQARYVGTLGGPGISSYIADRVLTWSGLTPWTQAGRHAFGMGFMREAAEQVEKSFDQLPEAFKNTFERHGIFERQWDLMRKAPLYELGPGTGILRFNEIAERIDPKLAEKYLGMIQTETEFAIPSGSHRSRTAILDQNQPGTFIGEVLRSAAQFKSFPAVFVVLHGARIHSMLMQKETRWAGAKYAGSLLISTTLFGALAAQLKNVAAGKDPQEMKSAAFWGAAMLQGGGLGIWGDFLFADVNRFGGGLGGMALGPLGQRVDDLRNLTIGNLGQLASGKKTHFGREAVRFASQNIPGSNIWFLRLAWERGVIDQINWLVDPEANKAFKRRQANLRNATGQEYYWRPGEVLPARAPELGAIAGN